MKTTHRNLLSRVRIALDQRDSFMRLAIDSRTPHNIDTMDAWEKQASDPRHMKRELKGVRPKNVSRILI